MSGFLFPPFFIFPLGFVVFPVLFYFLSNKNFLFKKKIFQFLCGFGYGLGLNFIVLIWIKEPFFIDEKTKNIFYLSYLLVIYSSIFYGLIFLFLSFIKNNFSRLILIPTLFVIAEIMRANIGYGFPWITFSQVSSANNFTLSPIYFLGTYGLSFITIFIFISPSIFSLPLKNDIRKYNKFFLFILLIFLLFVTFSFFRSFFQNEKTENNLLDISLAQLNFKQEDKINNINNNNRLSEIINVLENSSSNLIIFAENDFPFLIKNPDQLNILKEYLSTEQAIIIGVTKREESKYFNSLAFIEKNSINFFDKKILVPFGEFLPFRDFLQFLNIFVGGIDYEPGQHDRVIKSSNNFQIIPIICYEIIFFNKLLNHKNQKADLLINITNDSWFGELSGPYQHFYLSKMRAVEFNKPLIRVSTNGISAIISNKGNVINFISLNEKKIINLKYQFSKLTKNNIYFHKYVNLIIILITFIGFFIDRKYAQRS